MVSISLDISNIFVIFLYNLNIVVKLFYLLITSFYNKKIDLRTLIFSPLPKPQVFFFSPKILKYYTYFM